MTIVLIFFILILSGCNDDGYIDQKFMKNGGAVAIIGGSV